jgi:hypothetical protein
MICTSRDSKSPKTRLTIPRRSALNKFNSPLLRLPGELRNRIYAYIFDKQDYIFTLYNVGEYDARFHPISYRKYNLSLLATSRQIYTETALLPYKLGRFHYQFLELAEVEWRYYLECFTEWRSEAQIRSTRSISVLGGDGYWCNIRYCYGTGMEWVDFLAKKNLGTLSVDRDYE